MTHDEHNSIERLQNDVEREIITLKALVPDPRMLEIFVVMGWRASPGEEEQGWIKIALNTAKRIREHNSCSTHA